MLDMPLELTLCIGFINCFLMKYYRNDSPGDNRLEWNHLLSYSFKSRSLSLSDILTFNLIQSLYPSKKTHKERKWKKMRECWISSSEQKVCFRRYLTSISNKQGCFLSAKRVFIDHSSCCCRLLFMISSFVSAASWMLHPVLDVVLRCHRRSKSTGTHSQHASLFGVHRSCCGMVPRPFGTCLAGSIGHGAGPFPVAGW